MRLRYWLTVGLAALLLCAGWLSRAQATPGRQAWEYRQITFHGDYDQLANELVVLGAQGYELVLVSPQETVAIFKRPTG